MKIEKINLTRNNLKKIMLIDSTFYKEEILDENWYCERYKDYHEGLLLYNDSNECVGYLVFVPVKKELFKAIKSGTIVNDLYINPKMFVEKSKYYYLVSIVILDEYRNNGYGTKMYQELFNYKKGLFVVLTISEIGLKLSSKFMKFNKKLNDTVNVLTKHNI